MSKKLVLEFAQDLPEVDLQDKEVLMKAKEGAVMELLRKGRISQGKAAELLNISRQEFFDLMAKHNLPIADFSPVELDHQRKNSLKNQNEQG